MFLRSSIEAIKTHIRHNFQRVWPRCCIAVILRLRDPKETSLRFASRSRELPHFLKCLSIHFLGTSHLALQDQDDMIRITHSVVSHRRLQDLHDVHPNTSYYEFS